LNKIKEKTQRDVCNDYNVKLYNTADDHIIGVSNNIRVVGVSPIHGLRHNSEGNTTGWYIWAGEYSDVSDFFQPHHGSHLEEWCPQVIKFLGLPPGWRFLIAEKYEDVWYDEALLNTALADLDT
jgi:hypothetical protein